MLRNKGRWFKHQRFNQPFEIKAQNPCNPWKWRPQKQFRHRKRSDHKVWKRKWVFLRLQVRGQITWKTVPCLNCNQPKSVEPEGIFFNHGTICHKTQKQTEWWNYFVLRQYYKHYWITVLNLINNSLINCAGTNSTNFTMILIFIAQNLIHFKTQKTPGFPGFLFSATRNPGFKILPRIGNTSWKVRR